MSKRFPSGFPHLNVQDPIIRPVTTPAKPPSSAAPPKQIPATVKFLQETSERPIETIQTRNIDVPLAVIQICEQNANRISIVIQNTGLFPVWVSHTAQVAVGNGIPLAAMTAAFAYDGGMFVYPLGTGGKLWAIAETGASEIVIIEGLNATVEVVNAGRV